MKRCFYRAIVVLASLGFSTRGVTLAATTSPTLTLPCTIPIDARVACRLTGQGFHAQERVAIVYTISISTPGNGHRMTVYHRVTWTDGRGGFTRPVLRFAVDPRVESYVVRVEATGARGERVIDDFISIAQ